MLSFQATSFIVYVFNFWIGLLHQNMLVKKSLIFTRFLGPESGCPVGTVGNGAWVLKSFDSIGGSKTIKVGETFLRKVQCWYHLWQRSKAKQLVLRTDKDTWNRDCHREGCFCPNAALKNIHSMKGNLRKFTSPFMSIIWCSELILEL